MRLVPTALTLVLALSVIGCGSKEPKPEDNGGDVKTGVDSPQPNTTVPDSLKTAGYEYIGLGNSSVMTYDVSFDGRPPGDGTQVTTVEGVEGGVATFRVARTGELGPLGVDKIEARPDGIYMVQSSMGDLAAASLVLPSDVKVGSAWTTRMDMDNLQDSKNVKSQVNNKVTKIEPVTVPAGTFDCIVIETSVDTTMSGSPIADENGDSKTVGKMYYAKGVGIVKFEFTVTKKNRPKQSALIELKSIGEGEETDSSP